MSYLTVARPNEFTAVSKIANHYAAVHFQNNVTILISKRLEHDLKVAQASAESFAILNMIHHDETLFITNRPLMTIYQDKNETKWYPAELHSDNINVLKNNDELYSGTPEHARAKARTIARTRGLKYFPSLGFSLAKENA